MTKQERSFPVSLTKCSTHDCKEDAQGWLKDPEGEPIPGVSCVKCAELCIREYRDKLGEHWMFDTGYIHNAGGTMVRSLRKPNSMLRSEIEEYERARKKAAGSL